MNESKVSSGGGANGGSGGHARGDGDLIQDNKNMEGLTQAEATRRLKVSVVSRGSGCESGLRSCLRLYFCLCARVLVCVTRVR